MLYLQDLQEAFYLFFSPVLSAWLILVVTGGVLAAAFSVFMEFVVGFDKV